jgi:hypothetical protein
VTSALRTDAGLDGGTHFDSISSRVSVVIPAKNEAANIAWVLRHMPPTVDDLVKGSRFMAGGASTDITTLRRLGNRGLLALTNIIYGTRFTDLCYGFCAFRRSALSALALSASGFEIETELIVHATMAGLRISEVPSVESPRRYGQSNLRTFRDGRRVLWTLLRERAASRHLSARPNTIQLTQQTGNGDNVVVGVDK